MLDKLDPKDKTTQAYVLVGRFLSYFALLESTINNCVGKVLRLDGLQTYIVTRNTQFRDKINILKAAATLALPQGSALVGLLDEAASISKDRNIVAHEVFGVSEDERGVEFLAVRARGKLTFPKIVWTPKYFQEKYDWMHRVTKGIQHETESGLRIIALADALVKQPTNVLAGLAPYSFLSPHTPLPLHSPVATPQPDGETLGFAVPSDSPKEDQ
jgi:hypothetical protein